MGSKWAIDVDFIEELRLRRWARENYVPVSQRDRAWHPIIHEEMNRKDMERYAVENRHA
jgi:hypothetical protein